jgi:hypothetical protein
MRINKTQIERRRHKIRIRQRNKHRPINRRIALIGTHIWLNGLSIIQIIVPRDIFERTIGDVQLTDPNDVLSRAGRRRCDVRVVRPDRLPWSLPFEVNFLTGIGEGDGTVLGDYGQAGGAGGVGALAEIICCYGSVIGGRGGTAKTNEFVEAGLGCVDAGRVGLIENFEAGKFCQTRRFAFAGQEEM